MAKLIFLLVVGTVVLSGLASANPGIFSTEGRAHKIWAKWFLQRKTPSAAKEEKLKEIRRLSPFPQASAKSPQRSDVCLTDACIDSSMNLLQAINFTANPCEDFFQFACGQWIARNPIPPSASAWSYFDILIDEVNNVTQGILTSAKNQTDFVPVSQAKDFYNMCSDTGALEREGLSLVLAQTVLQGGWPAITPGWAPNNLDVVKTIADSRRTLLDSPLVSIYVDQDLKNTSRSVLYLDQPGFFLSRTILLNPDVFAPRIEAYKQLFVSVAKQFVVETGAPVAEEDLIRQAEDVIAFEIKLANISASDVDRSNIDRVYNPRTLDVFQAQIDAVVGQVQPHARIAYKSLLDRLFATSTVDIQDKEDLIVLELDYLGNLTLVLNSTSPRTIANYLHWRIVSGLIPETTQVMRDIVFEFDKINSGISVPTPRQETCASISLNIFGMAIGVKYIEEAFDTEAKVNVDLMVENLRVAFKELLEVADWMDNATKVEAERKVNSMRQFMAYPEWLFDKERLEQEYQGLEIVDGRYLLSIIGISNWIGDQSLNILRKPVDKDLWLAYPGVVNAFYAPTYNSITFPAGILQPPFYRNRGPEAINYGGIGVVIGHEITHGFDNSGSQFDAEGNAENWWSNEVLLRFYEKAQCIIDQYSGFEALPGIFVDGELTAGENIADNGGLREAYLAYRNWVQSNNGGVEEPRLPGLEQFSPDQLFYIGYANLWCESITVEGLTNQLIGDPHSPARFRVLGPLRNSEKFAELFNCPASSPMNPQNKCVLW